MQVEQADIYTTVFLMGNDPRSTTSLTRDIVAQPRAMDNVADLYRYISVMQPIATRRGASVYTRPCALIAIKHSTLHYRDRLPPPAARLIFPGGGTPPPCAPNAAGSPVWHTHAARNRCSNLRGRSSYRGCKIYLSSALALQRPCLATGAPFCSRSLILFLLLTRGR